MLAAKFVTAEASVAQPAPHQFFGPGFLLAQYAGSLAMGHYAKCKKKRKK
jgi:hypothetical protein